MPNQLSFLRNLLYELKKSYGIKIDFYKMGTQSTNLETGVTTSSSKIKYPINKAVLLPRNFQSKAIYDLTYIAANKNFTYGGLFDENTRVIIIDAVDLRIASSVDAPQYVEIKSEDYIVIDHSRYEIKNVEALERKAGYSLIVKHLVGARPYEIHTPVAFSQIRFNNILTEVLE